MNRTRLLGAVIIGLHLLCGSAGAHDGDTPRSAFLAKEAGDLYLEQGRFADAVDLYLFALRYDPDSPAIHYNLGTCLLKGFRAYDLAVHHFEEYLRLEETPADREQVVQLLDRIRDREAGGEGSGPRMLGGRLLVSSDRELRMGEALTVRTAADEELSFVADYVYPDGQVLCNRTYDASAPQELGEKGVSTR